MRIPSTNNVHHATVSRNKAIEAGARRVEVLLDAVLYQKLQRVSDHLGMPMAETVRRMIALHKP